jgi:hypothetical protein
MRIVEGKLLEAEENDVALWTWLRNILEKLGGQGMSSDESEVGDGLEPVFRPKVLRWRRKMETELGLIDANRVGQKAFGKQGSKPVKRRRHAENAASTREPVDGLPRSFYDDSWFVNRTGRDRIVKASQDEFPWMTVLWNNPRVGSGARGDVEGGFSS